MKEIILNFNWICMHVIIKLWILHTNSDLSLLHRPMNRPKDHEAVLHFKSQNLYTVLLSCNYSTLEKGNTINVSPYYLDSDKFQA